MLGDGGPISPAERRRRHRRRRQIRRRSARPTAGGRPLKLVTPEAPLTRGDDGLFRAADGDLPADPNARVQDGALEGSNVNPVETMVAMIARHGSSSSR